MKNPDLDKPETGRPLPYAEEEVETEPNEGGGGGDMPGEEEGSSPRTRQELDEISQGDARRRDEAERRLPDVGFEPMSDEEEPPDFDF